MRLGRRRFLAGLGAGLAASTVGLPPAHGAPGGTARRLVVFFTPNGTIHRQWRPSGGETDFRFPAGSILEPLAAQRERLVILDGLDFHGVSNHEGGMAAMLTGGGGPGHVGEGASIDQFVARHIGGASPFASLELGVLTSAWGGNVQTRMSYARQGEHLPNADRPADVHRRVFGAVVEPGAADDRLARRASILDLLQDEVADLRASAPRSEHAKLDAHLDALRRAETTLTSPGVAGCALDAPTLALDPGANDAFPAVGRAQMDLLVAALACGQTRVASLQWSHTVGPVVFSWLGIAEGHHSLSHFDDANTAGVDAFVRAERWFAEQFAYLLQRLEDQPDPESGGSLLDSTLVLWAQELGDGRLHECRSVPWVLAGGPMRGGRYLQLGGAPHQQVLTSVARALGVDTESYGDPSYGTGPLAELES
ncbi:MAG: Tat (twin-arginine translocation) pathway signal sequence domain protein [Sandaracinus sp.]|nr:Tat (twin-arginine translocation) pathway signal sequence domain protein [Sandaracinus sp.]